MKRFATAILLLTLSATGISAKSYLFHVTWSKPTGGGATLGNSGIVIQVWRNFSFPNNPEGDDYLCCTMSTNSNAEGAAKQVSLPQTNNYNCKYRVVWWKSTHSHPSGASYHVEKKKLSGVVGTDKEFVILPLGQMLGTPAN